MKKLLLIISLFCIATTMSAQKTKTLEILHTNDTHSCILPLNPNLADTVVAGRGGFLRRIAMLNEERKQNPDLLLFDSGDFSQGSPFYTMFKGDVEIGLMNRMKYDAVTIGNHEFDFGMENMARLFRMAEFPIVCANYDFTANMPLGVGVKYKIGPRLNLGVEWTEHFSLSDNLDGKKDPYGIESTGLFKNTDCYSTLQITLTYSFSAKCKTCHNEDE